ncbi:MAG: hypothetical protein HQ552_01620 [Desulfobacteraceae bacterium]|nr:hypothetical protein [Desulfobacteraceae bacterium]
MSGNRKGQFSIRINDQFRICFKWTETGPADVELNSERIPRKKLDGA